MPDQKDVVLGIMGASGALAGLLLVFSGFIFAQAASFPPADTDDKMIARYTRAARMALYPFLGFLLTTLLSLAWLLYPQPCIYKANALIFAVLVLATGIYGALISYRYL